MKLLKENRALRTENRELRTALQTLLKEAEEQKKLTQALLNIGNHLCDRLEKEAAE